MQYYRLPDGGGSRLAAVSDGEVFDLTSGRRQVTAFEHLANAASIAGVSLDDLTRGFLPECETLPDEVLSEAILPVIPEEVWAAGVTYKISEEARQAESTMPDIYLDVYDSDRPELFFKATADRTVGPDEPVGVRGDSNWNVPEPELGLVIVDGDIVGYTIGNDVSSRSIEGQNPLYLPQAKIYARSCAIGPCVASTESVPDPLDLELSMRVSRDGTPLYEETASTGQIVRSCEELSSYLARHNDLPNVTVLLTGTSLVPPEDFNLQEGDVVCIDLEGVGRLENDVVTV